LCIVIANKPNETLKNRREKKEEEGRRKKNEIEEPSCLITGLLLATETRSDVK
jgi:hypothetical protein